MSEAGDPANNTVMIVDDSKIMVKMVSTTIKEMGYNVISANDGQEALNALNQQKVKLVITDLNMPIMDGLTLVKEVRASVVNKDTPIIMVTTESDKEKIKMARDFGASGYIIKPWLPDKLKMVVENVCNKKL